MTAESGLAWPTSMTDELARQSHLLIGAVTRLGGAIGWMSPPTRAETDEWLAGVFTSIAAGDGALCTAWRDDRLVAMGAWLRDQVPYFRHLAELVKIMVDPRARGARLGGLVTQALIASAAAAGIETLVLGVRGNNHLAIELYAELGFVEWAGSPMSSRSATSALTTCGCTSSWARQRT